MRDKVEIHNYERKIANTLKRIEDSSIGEEDKQLLLKFHKECTIKGLSKARILKYFDVLGRIAIWFNKPLQRVKKEDMMNLVQRVESSDYSEWTKHDYKVVLKIFYRWLRRTEDYPEEVKWIKASFRRHSMLPEEILKEDDIKKLVECATSLRDKAFILVPYESGCRIGEILSLRIRNVQFDDYGAILIVSGKTGDRRVRIIVSAPKLAAWPGNVWRPGRDLDPAHVTGCCSP